jgi:7,8-dihydropterin-6-yl-methyl-4-(beta-D-ribofuranosyl)aminobenzene 5'-phosphate synthase
MTEVTILADNHVRSPRPKGLQAEWGFAAAVDGLLFDAGQTGVAAENARKLGIDPRFETIVLSHGHYDHTGGLPSFVDNGPQVYAHPDAFEPRFHESEPIGFPYDRDWLESQVPLRIHTDPVEVAPDLWALGEIPREYPDHSTGEIEGPDGRVPDPVRDDQALAVRGEDGLGLVLGCCHAGVRNTIEYAESVLDLPVRTVVGGTHLRSTDREELEAIADWLADRIESIAPSHCTSPEAETVLAERFEDGFQRVGVGTTIDL